MATSNVIIVFTQDFDANKKGSEKEVSRDLKTVFVDRLKVAKLKEEKEAKKSKEKK